MQPQCQKCMTKALRQMTDTITTASAGSAEVDHLPAGNGKECEMSKQKIDGSEIREFVGEELLPNAADVSDDAQFLGECILIGCLLLANAVEQGGR